MTALTAIANHRDAQLARGLAEEFGRDGWLVDWAGIGEAGWEARVTCPRLPMPVVGRGLSRVSAISQALAEALRRSGHVPRPAAAAESSANLDHRPLETSGTEVASVLTSWHESFFDTLNSHP